MTHFGSVAKIKKASKEELKTIKGLPITIINKVYDFFHSY
jgi:excinuclease UvrABC nuclease subunit